MAGIQDSFGGLRTRGKLSATGRCFVFAVLLSAVIVADRADAQFLVDGSNSQMGASVSAPDPLHFQNVGTTTSRAIYIGYDTFSGTGYLDNSGSLVANGTGTGTGLYDISEDWGIGVGIFPGGQGYLVNTGSGTMEASAIRVGDAFFGVDAYGELYHQSSGTVTAPGYGFLTVGNIGGTGKFFHTGSGAVNIGGELWVGMGVDTTGLTASNGTYELDNSGQLTVGRYMRIGQNGGSGTFTQTGGSVTLGVAGNEFTDFAELYLGHNSTTSNGTYNLEGGTLTINGWSNIGRDGAQATFNNAGTYVTTQELRVGTDYFAAGATAVLNNLDGGVIHAGTNGTIPAITLGGGFNGGATGTLNQHGVGSSVVADGWFVVGESGTGILNETNGTITVRDNFVVGHNATANGEIQQASGTNTVEGVYPSFTGNFIIGNAGTGELTQTGGANHLTANTAGTIPASTSQQNLGNLTQAPDGNMMIGALAGGQGAVAQSGGENLIAANLGVGLEGTGLYALSGSGSVTVGTVGGGDVVLAYASGSTGTFNLAGGTLDVSGSSGKIGAGQGTAAFNFTGGTLRVTEFNSGVFGGDLGGLVQTGASSVLDVTSKSTTVHGGYSLTAGTASVGSGQTLMVDGAATVDGTGTIGGAGAVNVTGDVDLSNGGEFAWQLGALSTSNPGTDFGVITSGGDLILGGGSTLSLDFSLLGGDGPDSANAFWTSNRTWKIVDAATNAGGTNFGSVLNANFASGSFSTQLGTGADLGDIFLKFTSDSVGQPGDFNGDGNVDGADFVIWQTNFPNNSGMATRATGDTNGDGNVDGADFVVWQTNFPTTAGGVTPVPEPSSIILGLGALAGLVGVRARRVRRE